MQYLEHSPFKLLITGQSGSGKSTYLSRYLAGCSYEKIFVYDHQSEFGGRLGIEPVYSADLLADKFLSNERYVIYDPAEEYPDGSVDGFNMFADMVYKVSAHMPQLKLFVCDELHYFVTCYDANYYFNCISATGRRRRLDWACISQRPNELHNGIRNQVTEIVTFKHMTKRAIEFMEPWIPVHEVQMLEPLEFISINTLTGKRMDGKISYN